MCLDSRQTVQELLNLPPLVLKAKHLSGSAFCWDLACLSRQWDGNHLGLGLVVEDTPSEFVHVLEHHRSGSFVVHVYVHVHISGFSPG